jgi:hypothetical protein
VIEIQLVWLLIGGELVLVLAVALAALLIMGARRRRQDRASALKLIQSTKEREAQRKEETSQWLQPKFGLSGEALERGLHDMLKAEKLLIQRVVNLYVKRDRISLHELNIDVEAVGEPYRKLEISDAPVAAAGEEGAASGDGDNDALRMENENLKQELQITMETMSRMLGEYASMFGSSQAQGAAAAPPPAAMDDDLNDGLDADLGADLDDGLDADLGADLDDEQDADQEGLEDLENLEGLEELEDLEDLTDAPPSTSTDETVQVDLSDDDIANIFGDDDLSADEHQSPVRTDAEGNAMDDELADMWADALDEQDQDEKK